MAEVNLRLSKAEADALQQDWWGRKSNARRAAEFKLRQAIWTAYPDLREKDRSRAERKAHDDDHHRTFTKAVLGVRP
jgi:hypothetical protein